MGRKLPLLRRGGALRVVIVLPPREDEPRQLLTMSLSEPTESESKRGKSSQGSYWTTTLRGRTMSTSDNVFLWEWLLYNHIDGWNHIDIRQCLSLNHKVNHKKVQRVVIAQLCWPTTMYFSEPKESESRSMWKLTWRGGTASNKCFSEPKANGQKVIKHHHRQFKTHTHNHHRHWLKFGSCGTVTGEAGPTKREFALKVEREEWERASSGKKLLKRSPAMICRRHHTGKDYQKWCFILVSLSVKEGGWSQNLSCCQRKWK